MLVLPRTDSRGRKRKRLRIEELIEISIQDIVTNKPWARNPIFDNHGNRLEFVDELDGRHQQLVVYINGHRSSISFALVDLPIVGRIRNRIPWDRSRAYFVLENGKRYRSLYIDPIDKRIGSRDSLRAVYTSESVGRKQSGYWRELQKIRKRI